MLPREEPPGAAEPGLYFIEHQQRVCPAAQDLCLGKVPVGGHVHALALHRLDEEGGHVAAIQLPAQRVQVGERDRIAAGEQRLEPISELLVAVHRQGAVREAVEAALAVQDSGTAGRGPCKLDRRLHRLAAGVDQHHRVQRVGRAADQFLGQHPGQRRDAELRKARGVGQEHALELALDERMVSTQGEHAVAGVEVEVLVALAVDQVRAAAGDPLAVEAQRLQDPSELVVEIPLVELHGISRPQRRQVAEVRPLPGVVGTRDDRACRIHQRRAEHSFCGQPTPKIRMRTQPV